jgi:hypothetical protein
MGGCGGLDFTWHYEGESVKELECWGNGASSYGGFTALKLKFTNEREAYIGSPKGESVKFVFDPQEKFHGDITLAGNDFFGKIWNPDRVGYLAFTTGLSDGSTRSFECGKRPPIPHKFPADGLILAGLFGKGGSDIDQLGLILREQSCPVESQEIIDVKCKGKTGPGGLCEAAFSEDAAGAHLTNVCDFCDTESPGKCEGHFQYTRAREISTTSTEIDAVGFGVEFENKFEANLIFAKSETSITLKLNYEHTWEESNSQVDTESIALESACESSPKPHSRTNMEMTVVVGTVTGDLEFTMKTKRKCEDQPQITTHDGTVTIRNVPITTLTNFCKVVDVPCDATTTTTLDPSESTTTSSQDPSSEDPTTQEPTTDITTTATTTQTTSMEMTTTTGTITTSSTTSMPTPPTPPPAPKPSEKECRVCSTMCARCQICVDSQEGECYKCWHCWDYDDDELEDDDHDMDKDCDALHKDHDWDDNEVRCFTDELTKLGMDCRVCWDTFAEMMAV